MPQKVVSLLYGCILVSIGIQTTRAAAVHEAWAARYDGAQHSNDIARAIAVDATGNVYVTGESYTNSQLAFTTLKYGPTGGQLWAIQYIGHSNGPCAGTAVAVDEAGHVYVTGYSPGTNQVAEFTTLKYDPDGTQLWVARYQGPGQSRFGHRPSAIQFDSEGNLCVMGDSESSSNTFDTAMVKYDADGRELSVTRYVMPNVYSTRYSSERHFVLDASGQMFVTTETQIEDFYGMTIAKYDTNGNRLWDASYASGKPNAITVDAQGNVYVAGELFDLVSDILTLKYDSDGHFVWAAIYDGPVNWYENGYKIAVDTQGNVFVAGNSAHWKVITNGPDELEGLVTVKYNAQGQEQWVARYPMNSDYNYTAALLLDSSGRTYLIGSGLVAIPGNGYDYVAMACDTNGSQRWVALYNGSANFVDEPTVATLDGSGNLYVTGMSYGIGTGSDFATVKYVQQEVPGAPLITGFSGSQVITQGQDIALTVTATGDPPLTYQWRWTGFDYPYWQTNEYYIVGATNPTLVLPSITFSNFGDYSVMVSNALGFTVSAEARLTIRKPFRLRVLPVSDGHFQFELSATPAHNYSIEASSDLTNWTVIQTFILKTDQQVLTGDEISMEHSRRFYRVRLEEE